MASTPRVSSSIIPGSWPPTFGYVARDARQDLSFALHVVLTVYAPCSSRTIPISLINVVSMLTLMV
jgi:hypothetical protein